MVIHKVGNLVKEPLDAFVHQANCFCTMGSGVAKDVKSSYPEVYEADCRTVKGDVGKLGTFSFAKTHDGKVGYNLYSQFNYGYDGKLYTNYDAMRHGLEKIRDHVKSTLKPNAKLGIPCRMGCARGGGEWNVVLQIIKDVFEKDTIKVIICEFKEYSNQSSSELDVLRKAYKRSELMGTEEER